MSVLIQSPEFEIRFFIIHAIDCVLEFDSIGIEGECKDTVLLFRLVDILIQRTHNGSCFVREIGIDSDPERSDPGHINRVALIIQQTERPLWLFLEPQLRDISVQRHTEFVATGLPGKIVVNHHIYFTP